MNYYKVTYSNYNFRTATLGVKAENEKEALKSAKYYANNERFENAKVVEITEGEYLSFEQEAYKQEEIRF